MDEDKISMKDIPSYHWPTKEKGKAQYPKFAKDFQGTFKGLRIVVEPGGIDRYLGLPPGRRPNNADERAEWLHREPIPSRPSKTRSRCTARQLSELWRSQSPIWYHPKEYYRQSLRETSQRPNRQLDLSQEIRGLLGSTEERILAVHCCRSQAAQGPTIEAQ